MPTDAMAATKTSPHKKDQQHQQEASPSITTTTPTTTATATNSSIVGKLNVDHDDFVLAMNKIVQLVKARRRHLLETRAVTHHHRHTSGSLNGSATFSGSCTLNGTTTTTGAANNNTNRSPGSRPHSRSVTPNNSTTNNNTRTTPRRLGGDTMAVSHHPHHPANSPSANVSRTQSMERHPQATATSEEKVNNNTPRRAARSGGAAASSFPKEAVAGTPQHTEEALAHIAAIRAEHTDTEHCTAKANARLAHRNLYAPVLVALAGTAGSGKSTAVSRIVEYLGNIHKVSDHGGEEGCTTTTANSVNATTDAVQNENKTSSSTQQHQQQQQLFHAHTNTPIRAVAVPLDGYHRYRTELDQMADPTLAFTRRGAPFTFNPIAYERDMLVLLHSAKVAFPSFEHHIKDPREDAIVVDCSASCAGSGSAATTPRAGGVGAHTDVASNKSSPLNSHHEQQHHTTDFGVEVVIVEGLYTLFTGDEQIQGEDGAHNPNPDHKDVPAIPAVSPLEKLSWRRASELYDLRLFVECDLEKTTRRLTNRHMAAWGIPYAEAHKRASGSDYDNSVVVARTAGNADVVLRSVEVSGL